MDEPSPKQQTIRPRFSLLTVLLLMTIAGLTLVIWRQWREVVPLREEVRNWRDKNGALTITEPDKIQIMSLEALEPSTWRWRIYFPPGKKYELHLKHGKGRPGEMYPVGHGWQIEYPRDTSKPQEIILTAAVRHIDGEPYLVVTDGDELRYNLDLPKESDSWTRFRRGGEANERKTIVKPDMPLELFRYEGTSSATEAMNPGSSIWITPVRPRRGTASTSQ